MAKTADNRYRSRRRRSRGKAYIVVAAILIIAAAVLAVTVFFRISAIKIEGCQRYTEQEIAQAAGITKGGSLLFEDTGSVAQTLYGKFPYIQEVTVEKHIPGGVTIRVTEAQAAAVVEQGGAYWLVGTNGRVLQQADRQEKDNYITLLGLDIQETAEGSALKLAEEEASSMEDVTGLLAALYKNSMVNMVAEIDFTDSFDITLRFRDKYSIAFGRAEDMDYKVRYVIEIIEYLEEKEENRPGIIDISSGGEAHFIPDGEE